MPSLLQHNSQSAIKLLLIGDPGSGKTGSLVSLIEMGFELAILDFDNGLDIIVNIIKTRPNANELLSKIQFETVTDKMKFVAGKPMVNGMPKAFSKGMDILTNWAPPNASANLGPLDTWPPNRILVLDSLTHMSNAAFRLAEVMVGTTSKGKDNDPRAIYGEAQKGVEGVLALLYSESIKCNVIVTAHITFLELSGAPTKGYPSSVGRALSPRIGGYFNTVLEAKTVGSGAGTRHEIHTLPDGMIDLKNSAAPGSLPGKLPLETGLADYFKLLGVKPS